jgi:hypothetical protein
MTNRSPERAEFLADVICTFAEGGIQMIGGWVITAETHPDASGIPAYDSVTVQYCDEEETHVVNLDTIAKAFGILRDREVKYLHTNSRARYLTDYRELDAGDIDAVDAANLVEIALFGEVVYA